jgi:ATP-binding cassette subfamily F protein 3
VLRLEDASKSFGGRALFEGAALHVRAGDRVGLVGRNGAGKTTLLRMLAGKDAPDTGQVVLRRGARVGYLRQEVSAVSDRTVLAEAETALEPLRALERRMREMEETIARDHEHVPDELASRYDDLRLEFERAGGFSADAELRATLVGLGLGPEKWDQPLAKLSGGWLMRVELAKLLIARPEVLLLDEPTNHLDLPSIRWFEGVLAGYPGSVVVVSHDRVFLDRHCNRIAELSASRLTSYKGNYSAYVEQKALRLDEAEARRRNLEREIAEKERFVDRFKAKASKASQAQSRVKQIAKLRAEQELLPTEQNERTMRVRFKTSLRSGETVLRLERAAKAYGEKVVYRSLDFELRRAERVALVGPNGAGKSTLLRLAAGAFPPDKGARELGHNVRAGFYAQHQVDALEPTRTVLRELVEGASIDDIPRLRSILGAFLFSGDDVDKRVSVLSGGEKARLALAKLLLASANFLVLDEPTNHLDMEARDVLTSALAGYEGTLLFVSHDRRFINSLATRVVEVTPGDDEARVREFLGNYDFYESTLAREAAERAPKPVAKSAKSAAPAPSQPGSKPAAPRPRDKGQRKLREQSAALEARIEAAEAELQRLDWAAADPAAARDGDRMRDLALDRRKQQETIASLYTEWEQITRQLEE